MNEKNVAPTKNRFYILDLLRFFAAIAVVFYHYSVYFDKTASSIVDVAKYGYLGVDFFFLLSGFVIMATAKNKTPFGFAIARALRIYPAFIVCVLLTVSVLQYVGGVSTPVLVWLSNTTILNDYLGFPNVDGVYWTLQAELKFYGCVFLLLFVGLFKYWRFWLVIWLAMAICHHFYGQPFFMGWFINPHYSFYFIAGVCAYLLCGLDKSILVQCVFWVSAVFGILVAGAEVKSFIPDPSFENMTVARIIVAIFFCFFYAIASGLFNVKNPRWWWVYLGAASYPLYLLHNMIGKTFINYFAGSINIYALAASVLALILALSFTIHFFIEKPFYQFVEKVKSKYS